MSTKERMEEIVSNNSGKSRIRRLVIIVENQGIFRTLVERELVTLRRRLRDLKATNSNALEKVKVITVLVHLKNCMLIILKKKG